jgi:fructose-1,6-bisphosphatase I
MTGSVTLDDAIRTTTGDEAAPLGAVLAQIALAGRTIARELSRAALVGQLGTTGDVNVQGETVKKLDVWANNVMVRALDASGVVCTMISEEMPNPLHLDERCARARYVVCFDPVDGSSNLDVNGIVGTIFGIRRRTSGAHHVAADAMRAGTAQVAAGYVMYGPSTVMVLTTGDGVHGFTLDPSDGRFVLSHEAVRMPARGHIYSINDANMAKWERGVREFIAHLRDGTPDRPFTARYVGSLVADFHRTLLDGGIFLYPAGPQSQGKLRLQYEAAPMALIAEQAGGSATTGRERILDIVPSTYHQRVPLVIGSAADVALAEEFIAGRR